jgi:hypothetical protein
MFWRMIMCYTLNEIKEKIAPISEGIWNEIKGMKNLQAYDYEKIDLCTD